MESRGNPNCERCHGDGWYEIERKNNGERQYRGCVCVLRKRQIAQVKRAGFVWENIKSLDEYETNDPQLGKRCEVRTNAKKIALLYVENWRVIRNQKSNCLVFCGHKGSGKTHLLLGIMKGLMERFVHVTIVRHAKMMELLKDYENGNSSLWRLRQNYMETPVLLIDDFLEVERKTGAMTRQDYLNLKVIFDFRYTNNLPVITSSQCLPGLMEELADEIYDRIEERTLETIVFDGPQYNFRPEEARRNAERTIKAIQESKKGQL